MSEALAARSSLVFMPRAGETEWWRGDPRLLPLRQIQDSDGPIIMRRGVLSATQCALLTGCFERNRDSCATRDAPVFWAGRFIWQDTLPETEVDALRLMQQVRLVAQQLLIRHMKPDQPLYSDTAQLVRWHEGVELTPHTDNMEPDGPTQCNAAPFLFVAAVSE